MCDKKCREKVFKFYELAAIMTEEEGTTHMINLCRNCYEKMRLEQGEAKVDGVEWKEMIKQKASRGNLLAAFGVDDFLRKKWEWFTVKKAWARTVLEEAARVTQLGIDGSWQNESSHKDELEFLRNVKDLRLDGSSMSKSHQAGKDGDGEEFLK